MDYDIQIKSGKLESINQEHRIKSLNRRLLELSIEKENAKPTYIFTSVLGYSKRYNGEIDSKIKEKFNHVKIPYDEEIIINSKEKLLFEDDKVFLVTDRSNTFIEMEPNKEQLFLFIPPVSSDNHLSRSERKALTKAKAAEIKGGNKSRKNKSRKNKSRKNKSIKKNK